MINNKAVSGELLRLLRHFKGVKQAIVANKMGKKQQYISKLENAAIISECAITKILTALNSNLKELEKIRKMYLKKS